MKAVLETIAMIGTPIFIQSVGEGPSLAATIARWRHGDAEVNIAASDTTLIAVSLQDRQPAQFRVGRDKSAVTIPAGSVLVVPAHQPPEVIIEGEADILQIFLSLAFLDTAAGGRYPLPALIDVHDSELQGAAMQLLVAATRRDPDDSLLLETGIHRIAARLLDRNHQPLSPKRSGLPRSAYRRVDDLITAMLDDETLHSPTLAQLAGAANLSVNHFIRAFHQQIGVTPHRYVVRRRVERAVALLSRPKNSVAEVADLTGFASPAHFVATFRRMMGVTPGAVRAALLR